MKEAFAIVASLLAVVGNVPYVRDVLAKKVQPHAYTWFVWSLVSGIIFFGQVAKGAGIGALPTFASEIFTFIIFLLSLRYGFKKITAIDTFFLLLALVGIGLWVATNDPTLSVIIAVIIDLIAFVPTILKTWTYPKTETPLLYSMNVARHALALFSLQAYNIATTLHSIAMITTNSIMTVIMLTRKGKPDGVDAKDHPVP